MKSLLFLACLLLVSFVFTKSVDNSAIVAKYFIFREDCFDKFVSDIVGFITDADCMKFTISKGIGLAIVAGSSILKLPQIIKILSSNSVEGLSALGMYLETVNFM